MKALVQRVSEAGVTVGERTVGAIERGLLVDTSLFEAGIVQTYWQSAIAFATGVAPGPMGSAHPLNAPLPGVRDRRTAGS